MRLTILLLLLVVALLQACNNSESALLNEPFRVAVLRYQHETCTFCPGGDADIEAWTKVRPVLKGKEVLEAGSYIRGFVKRAKDYEDIELIGISSPYTVFGGSSRAWNTEESFDHFMGKMIQEIKSQMPLDGVYLALHGAMAVRNIPRPEAEIAKRIRAVVGENVPIVGTFDLHGNEDEEFLKWADGAFVTKRYPHYDAFLQGERAAHYIRQIMRGDYEPTKASRKPPILTPTVVQWTGQSPSMDIMERARRWESRHPDVFVSVFYGFPWSDVPDVGIAVHVMTNNDQVLADSIADDMQDYIWRIREPLVNRGYPMPGEAVDLSVSAIVQGKTPVVLGDYSDRPGDATWILQELINKGVSKILYGTLRDENALDLLTKQNAQVGDEFDMAVGGFTGEQAGSPVRIQGTIRYFGPKWGYDKIAAIEWGDENMLILTPAYEQVTTPGQLRFADIEPNDYEVFVVKSRVHFRRGFDETGYAKTIHVVDAPGPWFGTIRLDALDYQYAPIDKLYPYQNKLDQ